MKNREKKAATAEKRRQRMVLILCVAILALAIVAVNVRTVVYGYYDSFVRRGVDVDTGRQPSPGAGPAGGGCSVGEAPSRRDSWRYSRLRESVTTEAQDGTELHGYLYDEGSDVTANLSSPFPRHRLDDFLMGPWAQRRDGGHILMLDPRAHGESGGDYFSYGWKESEDLACLA